MSSVQYENMLVDGRNALYRAVYAGLNDQKFQESGADYFTIMMRFLHHYYATFKPKSVHIFWDDKSTNLWRTEFYPEYKATRDNSDIRETLNKQYKLALDLFRYMGFRQYFRKRQEADDLIYAFCRSFKEQTVIVSSDSDMKQIPYSMSHVDLYNPSKAGRSNKNVLLEEVPESNVVITKAFTGDKADNIDGYRGIGPVKGNQYTTNLHDRAAFFKSVDPSAFIRNRKLIDLGLCPDLLDNMLYVEKHRTTPVQYNYKALITKFRDLGVTGAIAEADRCVVQYSELIKAQ